MVQEIDPSASSGEDLEDPTEGGIEDAFADALNVTTTIVSLSSYDGEGAQDTMSDVSAAAEACGSGFTATADGETQKFTKIVSEKGSGSGDESLAFAVTGDAEGDPFTVHIEVVRHSSTVATYYSFNLSAFAGGSAPTDAAADGGVPADIIKAQAAKVA